MRRLAIGCKVAAAIIVTTLLAAGCGSGGGSAKAGRTDEVRGLPRAGVTALLAGIPQRGSTLGDPKAPVTLVYFGDLQCPFCREFTLGALASLIRTYVRRGELKIEYRSLQTATRDSETFRTQQVAALAAGRQNRLWDFVELFYHEQRKENSGYVTEGYLQGLAEQVSGLNLLAWTVARNDSALTRAIGADARVASSAGFDFTPAFLFANTAGTLRRFKPRTLTNASAYALVVEQLLRLDRRRRPGGSVMSAS